MSGVRGTVINATTQFVIEDCCSCATLFALTVELRDRRLADHGKFYCPNGHSMSYSGKTEAQKARARAEELERQLASREDDLRVERQRTKAARASHAATKGQLTRTRKRAAAGVCPEPNCHRSIASARMAAHVKAKHPGLVLA